MIKLNLRWLIQATALVFSIASFTRSFNLSKTLISSFSSDAALSFLLWVLLFSLSFFVLMLTSYLKQRANFTLRKRMALFEKLIHLLHLENYKEREGVSAGKQSKPTREGAS
jgi:hypothetical protein